MLTNKFVCVAAQQRELLSWARRNCVSCGLVTDLNVGYNYLKVTELS